MALSKRRILNIGTLALLIVAMYGLWSTYRYDPTLGVGNQLTTPGGAYFVMGVFATVELLVYSFFVKSIRAGMLSMAPVLVGSALYVLL